jgi:small subunit ribosomal protein S18
MKQDYFNENKITHIDYKDVEILRKFINPHGRILSRRRTEISSKNQRKLASAIKRARIMGLLPFIER